MFCFCFLFYLFINFLLFNLCHIKLIYLKIYRIFAKFKFSVELRLWMLNLKIVFRSLKGRRHVNQFLLVSSGDLIFVPFVASGVAGRANVGLCPTSILTFKTAFTCLINWAN